MNKEDVEEFDKDFPPKEKIKLPGQFFKKGVDNFNYKLTIALT